jgi:hypothetical protein
MNGIVKVDPYLPTTMAEAEQLAARLAQSALLPDGLRGKPADVLITLITGHELGLSPMQSVRGLHVVKGRAVMSADLAVGLVKRNSACRHFRLVSSDDKAATYETLREGEPEPTRMTFTIDQARQAGLVADNWKRFPSAMLRARCSLALARAVYPDVLQGVYEPDEVGAASAVAAPPAVESRTVAPPPPKTQAPPAPRTVDAEVVPAPAAEARERLTQSLGWEPQKADSHDGPPALTPQEKALVLISEADSDAALVALAPHVTALGVARDAEVRAAFAARKRALAGRAA